MHSLRSALGLSLLFTAVACAPAPVAPPTTSPVEPAPVAPASAEPVVVVVPSAVATPATPAVTPPVVRCAGAVACAKEVAKALHDQDMATLGALVHPQKGVRFSPYAYVDTAADVVLKASELSPELASKKARLWGSFDGSGDPIRKTFAGYLTRFAADKAFLSVKDVRFNGEMRSGNTTNNARDVYPKSDIVEFYFPPSGEDQMDWAALRLVFEQVDGKPYLVAVIHDEWTI